MNEIISGQRIGHRKISSRKSAFRPAGIISLSERNANMIHHIKQEPVKIRRKKPESSPSVTFSSPRSLQSSAGKRERAGKTRESQGTARSFSLPLLPAAGFCLLIAGAFLVLSWDGDYLSWLHKEVVSVNPGADEGGRYNLALYAGLAPQTASGFISPSPAAPEETGGEAGETIPLDLAETFAWKSYTVKRGDSVSRIAAAHSLSLDAVIASNNISNARRLREGETLRIPNMDGIPYIVKKGDSLSRISRSLGVPMEAILDANDLRQDIITAGQMIFVPGARMRSEDLKLALGELFMYPLTGARLTSPFGWRNDPISGARRHHAAIDLAASMGTTVKAAMDGKVSSVGFNSTYGNYIILSHGNEYQTMYAHLSRVSVKKDGRVTQGMKIGEVGSTGYSTGPHLHFAVYKNGRPVNPLDFLNS
ncbi:MAG: M23 family metallopeptidase [Treponema sp.]|jgi:murein DD-endopeptidase MepM/ murein hydrolase activator NlpD|nr:M23 family metallopeptidase [Treponema sp.]